MSRPAFDPAERALLARLSTPLRIQRWLESLPYNSAETARSFRGVVRHRTAHCLEGAIAAVVALEARGHPPLMLSIDSRDGLGHAVALFRGRDGRWGGIARSRDPGLHGRRAVFRTPRDLVQSYVDPYIDYTGEVTGYAVVDLGEAVRGDWRLAEGNVWRVERALLDAPHAPIRTSRARVAKWRRWYRAFMERSGGAKPDRYPGWERWL